MEHATWHKSFHAVELPEFSKSTLEVLRQPLEDRAARQIQTERFKDSKLVHCNAQMTDRMMHQFCALDEETNDMLRLAMDRLNLSARTYSRILKVARTIADLEGKENIEMHHVAEAVGYRSLDRADWAER